METSIPSLEEIKKVDWQYLVDRREAVLIASAILYYYKLFKETTLIPTEIKHGINANNSSLFYSKKELDEIRTYFANSDIGVFNEFIKNMLTYFKDLDKYSLELEKKDFSDFSDNDLIKEIEQFFSVLGKPLNFFVPFPTADNTLSKRILALLPDSSEEEKQKWLFTLTYPEKENEHAKEQRAFFNLIKEFKAKGKLIQERIDNYLKEFSWLGARWYWIDKEWKKEDVLARINEFISQKKEEKKELFKLDNSKMEITKERKSLIKKLKIKNNESLLELLDFAREFAFLRTYRSDILYRAGHRARNLFREISKRAGIENDDFVYLTNEELLEASKFKKSPISKAELDNRKQSYSVALLNGKVSVLSGPQWADKLRFLFPSKQISEIKGHVAYPGKIKGKVKLVFKTEDIKKVQGGDILVTVMTFPSFIPAMEKASAFVTDEGGILCHAAIISREMKKPCIIGTKNATKLLKDGDLIEVDANKGTLKKL